MAANGPANHHEFDRLRERTYPWIFPNLVDLGCLAGAKNISIRITSKAIPNFFTTIEVKLLIPSELLKSKFCMIG